MCHLVSEIAHLFPLLRRHLSPSLEARHEENICGRGVVGLMWIMLLECESKFWSWLAQRKTATQHNVNPFVPLTNFSPSVWFSVHQISIKLFRQKKKKRWAYNEWLNCGGILPTLCFRQIIKQTHPGQAAELRRLPSGKRVRARAERTVAALCSQSEDALQQAARRTRDPSGAAESPNFAEAPNLRSALLYSISTCSLCPWVWKCYTSGERWFECCGLNVCEVLFDLVCFPCPRVNFVQLYHIFKSCFLFAFGSNLRLYCFQCFMLCYYSYFRTAHHLISPFLRKFFWKHILYPEPVHFTRHIWLVSPHCARVWWCSFHPPPQLRGRRDPARAHAGLRASAVARLPRQHPRQAVGHRRGARGPRVCEHRARIG